MEKNVEKCDVVEEIILEKDLLLMKLCVAEKRLEEENKRIALLRAILPHFEKVPEVVVSHVSELSEGNIFFSSPQCYLYVLQLENDNYYVGFTENFNRRMYEHFSGDGGAKWTKVHKPIKVYEVIQGTKDKENEKTLEMMRKFGWEKVRGGSWSMVHMKIPPKNL